MSRKGRLDQPISVGRLAEDPRIQCPGRRRWFRLPGHHHRAFADDDGDTFTEKPNNLDLVDGPRSLERPGKGRAHRDSDCLRGPDSWVPGMTSRLSAICSTVRARRVWFVSRCRNLSTLAEAAQVRSSFSNLANGQRELMLPAPFGTLLPDERKEMQPMSTEQMRWLLKVIQPERTLARRPGGHGLGRGKAGHRAEAHLIRPVG
jgi:hypothetical protein